MTQSDKGHLTNAELADAFEHGKLWIAGDEEWMPWIGEHPRFKDQIIAALRQSSDKVLVPRALLLRVQTKISDVGIQLAIHNLLSAAEAEGHHE